MIVVCLKWVTHPGEPNDARFAGMSPADQSALEFALVQSTATGDEVTAITVGPVAAESVLRDALACGAQHGIRINAPFALASSQVAEAIASVVTDAAWVWCGDYSLDRGTGTVPAFLAGALSAQQALGIIAVDPSSHGGVTVTRRLDGGRRELLRVSAPAVVSVEGATAHLRRAGLGAVRAAAQADITVHQPAAFAHPEEGVIQPYRPRARAMAAPRGEHPLERLRALTDAGAAVSAHGETVVLEPVAAAARIAAALREWGYLT
jgi:electron transfer flavoprotein beta subunit